MSVTSGFFNSVNHDRLYNAEQVSSLFDGIISDGVYQNYGDGFRVVPNEALKDSVVVKIGRAWFDHTWTYNDSDLVIQLDPPNAMLQRIDAIVIDVNREQGTRKNSVLYVKGTFGESTPPSLANSDFHKQYPLAYIMMGPGDSSVISYSQITNKIGSEQCPVVAGILNTLNLDMYYQQLKSEFDIWWDGIKSTLDESTATKLQNQINELKGKVDVVENGSVDIDDYAIISNMEFKVYGYNIAITNAGYTYKFPVGAYFLPDKTLAVITATTSTQNGLVHFINPEENIVVSTENFESLYASAGAFVCVLSCNFNSFPCKITYLTHETTKNPSGYIKEHTINVYNLTITQEHTVSLSKVSASITESTVNSTVTSGYTNSEVPAYYGDGSSAMMFYSSASSTKLVYFGVKVSSDGSIAYNPTSSMSATSSAEGYSGNTYGLACLFMAKNTNYIYGTYGDFKKSYDHYFIDPSILQILYIKNCTDTGFASLWPKNYLNIYRPTSDTVYTYKAPDKLLKFSNNDYNYEVIRLKPNIMCRPTSDMNFNGFTDVVIIQADDKRYMLDRYKSYANSNNYVYSASSCGDKIGVEIIFRNVSYLGTFFDTGGSEVQNYVFNHNTGETTGTENTKVQRKMIDAGAPLRVCGRNAVVSNDGKYIFMTGSNYSLAMAPEPLGTYKESNDSYTGTENQYYVSPFDGGGVSSKITPNPNNNSYYTIYIGG